MLFFELAHVAGTAVVVDPVSNEQMSLTVAIPTSSSVEWKRLPPQSSSYRRTIKALFVVWADFTISGVMNGPTFVSVFGTKK